MKAQSLIQRERLARTFIQLCEIDSPSQEEGRMAARLREIFSEFGAAPPFEDDSASRTGSECGNLIFRWPGDSSKEALFFACHLDTVEPGRGIKVLRQGDIFTSAGDTILGSDDKAGIAALIEAWQVIQEHKLPHVPVEYIFTTCEEIGLLGAKALNPTHIQAKMGYALDSSGFGRVLLAAPALQRLHIQLHGQAAHAGLEPEQGINAIVVAAQALARVPCGRLDHETSVNFGTIRGGIASNIVAESVEIVGEIRSHCPKKLEQLSQEIEDIFRACVADWQDPGGQAQGRPRVDFQSTLDFPAMQLRREDPVIQRIASAAASIGLDLSYEQAGGGSDANVFNGYGLATAIVATGMTQVHSTSEQVHLEDMSKLTRLILALLLV
jgi:tripeptide aminopeptidase